MIKITSANGDKNFMPITPQMEVEATIKALNGATDELLSLPFWRIFRRCELINRIKYCSAHIKDLCLELIQREPLNP